MKTITETINACADFGAVCDIVGSIAEHGTNAELLEASQALRRIALERSRARALEASMFNADRNVKGAANKLAQEAAAEAKAHYVEEVL